MRIITKKPSPMRLTRQRQVILETLATMDTHPTANEFHAVVRRLLPTISVGSVHRNLELLADYGYILKLETGGEAKRFDGRNEPHAHVHCLRCGAVRDLWLPNLGKIRQRLEQVVTDHAQLADYRLSFVGHCQDCLKQLETKCS